MIVGIKDIFDLTIKAIKDIYNTENPTKNQIRTYKKQGKELIDGEKGVYIIIVDLGLSILMDCRTPTAVEFRIKLRSTRTISANRNNESICRRKGIDATLFFEL